MADTGSKTKGALAGVGIVAALGGGLARSADVALAGCRATRTVSVTAEGATAGQLARSGSNLADDGLRGASRAGLRHAEPVRGGRPWMVVAGEGDDGFRASSLDDIANQRGAASGGELVEGPSPVETALDLSLDVLDLAEEPREYGSDHDRTEGTLGLATTPFAESPRAVFVQTWPNDQDGGAGVPRPANVARVAGVDAASRGWLSVLRAMPHANPLVILASSNDGGRTLVLGEGRRSQVSDLHAKCTSEGRYCVTMLCAAQQDEPSPCRASLVDVFERTARASSGARLSHDAFALMLRRARATWDATAGVDIAYVKWDRAGGAVLQR